MDAGTVHAELGNVDLVDLSERLVQRFAPVAEEAGLVLTASGEVPCWAHTDPVLLGRVLENLVMNALRYTTRGSVQIHVFDADEQVVVEVRDTGIGIAPDQLDNIFDEYYQVENPQRDRTKGLGLGLAIVKRLCDLLELELSVDSQPGHGAKFRIGLPRGIPEAPAPLDPVAEVSFQGWRILVVEDDPEVQTALTLLLEGWGMEVDLIPHAQALEDVKIEPDLLLVDYRLPGSLDGVATVAHVQAYFGALMPAMIVTGDTGPDVIARVAQAHLPLLHKPVQAGDLKFALGELLDAETLAAQRPLSAG